TATPRAMRGPLLSPRQASHAQAMPFGFCVVVSVSIVFSSCSIGCGRLCARPKTGCKFRAQRANFAQIPQNSALSGFILTGGIVLFNHFFAEISAKNAAHIG